MATEFYIGQDVTILMEVTTTDGSPGNPTTVRFRVKPPTGTVTEYDLGDTGTGTVETGKEYSLSFDLTLPGAYKVRAEALVGSDVVGVNETVVYALASVVD